MTVISELPATEKQIAYARKLGLIFPDDINQLEMCDLLDCHLTNQKPANLILVSWASSMLIITTKYVGEDKLLNNISQRLAHRQQKRELIAWFGYWVARDILNAASLASDCSSPFVPLLQNLAAFLEEDEKVTQSICRYRGDSLPHFGERKHSDGAISTGASRRTTAYKRVAELIEGSIGPIT